MVEAVAGSNFQHQGFRRKKGGTSFILSVVLRLQRMKSDLKGIFICAFVQYTFSGPNYVPGIALGWRYIQDSILFSLT